jgi:hypothetical protein
MVKTVMEKTVMVNQHSSVMRRREIFELAGSNCQDSDPGLKRFPSKPPTDNFCRLSVASASESSKKRYSSFIFDHRKGTAVGSLSKFDFGRTQSPFFNRLLKPSLAIAASGGTR